jgi:hypothetical protein
MQPDPAAVAPRSRCPRGRPPVHGLKTLRRAVRQLTTRRLDGRSAIAVAVRRWKADVTADLGGNLSRAQETILEAAAQSWVILSSLDDYIARQPSLVTKKRQVVPVVLQRMQIADSLARHLERLGLERKAKAVPDLQTYLAMKALERPGEPPAPPSGPPSTPRKMILSPPDSIGGEGNQSTLPKGSGAQG